MCQENILNSEHHGACLDAINNVAARISESIAAMIKGYGDSRAQVSLKQTQLIAQLMQVKLEAWMKEKFEFQVEQGQKLSNFQVIRV